MLRRARCCGRRSIARIRYGIGERPQEANPDHDDADQRRVPDHLPHRLALEPVDDQRQLQADEDEQGRVEQEREHRPEREALHPGLGVDDLRRAPAEIDAAADHGEHAGGTDLVGRDERPVGGEERDRHRGDRVADPAADLGDDVADGEPDRDPAGDRAEELEHRARGRDALPHGRRDRDLVGDQGRRVVDQALALEDVDDSPRRADALKDRCGRDRVRGRDDRPERERDRPRELDHLVGNDGDGRRRDQHEPDRVEGDRPRAVAQAAQVGEERGRVQQRRQEDQQHQVGVELDARDPRHQPEQQATEHERDRVRDPQPVGERVQPGGRDEQRRDDDLQVTHGRDCRGRAAATARGSERQVAAPGGVVGVQQAPVEKPGVEEAQRVEAEPGERASGELKSRFPIVAEGTWRKPSVAKRPVLTSLVPMKPSVIFTCMLAGRSATGGHGRPPHRRRTRTRSSSEIRSPAVAG